MNKLSAAAEEIGFFLNQLTSLPESATPLFHFEKRPEQIEMLHDVLEALLEEKTALIEAGTGCGKSLAYLIPAIIAASKHHKKIVISTHTKNLQDQLIEKDIPIALNLLQADLEVKLLKGMSNYLCLRKLVLKKEQMLLSPSIDPSFDLIIKWAEEETEEGLLHEIMGEEQTFYAEMAADHHSCNHIRCPFYKKCHYFKAKQKAQEARLLVANHHLIFSDYAKAYNSEELSVMTLESDAYIFDEAHHIESIATKHFSKEISAKTITKILSELSFQEEANNYMGKLPLLKRHLIRCTDSLETQADSFISKIDIDFILRTRNLSYEVFKAFYEIRSVFLNEWNASGKTEYQKKWRLTSAIYDSFVWKSSILPHLQKVYSDMHEITVDIKNFVIEIESNSVSEREAIRHVLIDLKLLLNRLDQQVQVLSYFVDVHKEVKVRWIENNLEEFSFHLAELEIAKILSEFFKKPNTSAVLCSATLSTGKHFSYIKKALGLESEYFVSEKLLEKIYPSPFSFEKQARFYTVANMALPEDPRFLTDLADLIFHAVQGSLGGAFVLFTSFDMLEQMHRRIHKPLTDLGLVILKQRDKKRSELLNIFRQNPKSVLLGTDSFWEGVDVIGHHLRLVIIAKLPFHVPSEPLIEAKIEKLKIEGANPFFEFTLPQAAMKFKQGVGRLIRSYEDKGVVVCADNRLITKKYGKVFFHSIDNYPRQIIPLNKISAEISAFLDSHTYMECTGVEPVTSTMPLLRSTN